MNTPDEELPGEEGEEELEVELEGDVRLSFIPAGDPRVRAYIFELMADSQLEGRILAENCEVMFQWIMYGKVPPSPSARQPKVRPI